MPRRRRNVGIAPHSAGKLRRTTESRSPPMYERNLASIAKPAVPTPYPAVHCRQRGYVRKHSDLLHNPLAEPPSRVKIFAISAIPASATAGSIGRISEMKCHGVGRASARPRGRNCFQAPINAAEGSIALRREPFRPLRGASPLGGASATRHKSMDADRSR